MPGCTSRSYIAFDEIKHTLHGMTVGEYHSVEMEKKEGKENKRVPPLVPEALQLCFKNNALEVASLLEAT